ncbi:hypothetical protein Tco_1412245 [Tanacetum coccineum]
MQMLYCFVNNVHVDYAELLYEGLHYSLEYPSTLIPYLRFTKLMVAYYMTVYPEISIRVHDKYYNFENDDIVKSIFNSGKNKAGVGMKIPNVPTTQFRIPLRRSNCHTPTTPIPTAAEVEGMTVQYTIQLSVAEQKSRDDLEAEQNVKNVKLGS